LAVEEGAMSNVVVLGSGDSIVAVMSGAPTTTNPSFASSWVDAVANVTSSSKGILNGTTEVTIVSAPTSDERQVDFIRVYNQDTSISSVTVKIANGANRYPLGTWAIPVSGFIDVLTTQSGVISNYDRLSNLANPELTISAAATASTAQWNRCYATSAAYALTLPPVLASAGKIVGVRIDSSSTYNVTVTGTLDGGATTYLMIPGECAEFKSDGTTWQRISNNTVDGSWTPVATALGGTGITYNAHYAKHGNTVDISVQINGTAMTSTMGSTSLSMPFSSARTTLLPLIIAGYIVDGNAYTGNGNSVILLPTFSNNTATNFSGTIFLV
jgi:hypothetical protein